MLQLAREGYPFIAFFAVTTIASLFFMINWLTAVAFILTLFMLHFFRDPDRNTQYDPNAFIAPADGRIVLITEAKEDETLNTEMLKIGIFMSPLNVHVNRAPCDGTVKSVKHYPGKFFNASTDDASILNEHITMLLECKDHGPVVVKQIAGTVARRAVCRVKPGDTLKQGERYGMIKFSSRVDIFLPLDTEVNVKLDDKVTAGETIIAMRNKQQAVNDQPSATE
jgi:phosphatidylserine decarboxylase